MVRSKLGEGTTFEVTLPAPLPCRPSRSPGAASAGQVAQEPLAGELGYHLECARLLEQVACARDDLEVLDGSQSCEGAPVQLEHDAGRRRLR